MRAYALITEGGIYIFNRHLWCKTTAFPSSPVRSGWASWQRLDSISIARGNSQSFTPAVLDDVRPGDCIRIDGPDNWAQTSRVDTVLHVSEMSLDEDPRPGDITLHVVADSAWIIYATHAETITGTGPREIRQTAPRHPRALRYRVLREVRPDD